MHTTHHVTRQATTTKGCGNEAAEVGKCLRQGGGTYGVRLSMHAICKNVVQGPHQRI